MKSLVILALLAGVAGANPDTYTPPAFLAAPPALPAGHDATTALRLDLTGALQIAMQQNLGMSLERKNVEASRLAVDAATASMYEPVLTGSYQHGSSASPPATAQSGIAGSTINTATDGVTATLSQHLPTGGSVGVTFSDGRTNSTSGMAVLPVTYGASISFAITQPLLRGFSTDLVIPKYSILTAKIASEQERHNLEVTAAGVVQTTENAYWDLVGAMYAYDVAVDSVKSAEDTVELTRRQIAAGGVMPAELTSAQSTLAQRQLAVLQAAATVEAGWDQLRTALNLPRDQWTRPILPVEVPRFDAIDAPSVDDAIDTAMHHRPEVKSLDLDVKASELAMRKADNDRLPQIDLSLGGTLYGQDATNNAALGEIGAHDFSSWYVGVNVTWTPLHRANKVAGELAMVQHDMRLETHEQKVQQMWNEVRSAVRTKSSATLQVGAAAHARALAADSLALENKKYLSGASSIIALAQVQKNLVDAEMSELGALIGHEHATTALLLATGMLLDARHVQLQR